MSDTEAKRQPTAEVWRSARTSGDWSPDHPEAIWEAKPQHGFIEANWIETYGTGQSNRSLLMTDEQVLEHMRFCADYLIERAKFKAEKAFRAETERLRERAQLSAHFDKDGIIDSLSISESEGNQVA